MFQVSSFMLHNFMNQYIKNILISLLVSAIVVAVVLDGLFYGIKSGAINAEKYLPERLVIEKETIKEQPQVIEKYIPQTTQEQMIVDIVKKYQDAVVSVIASKDLPVLEQYYSNPFEGFGFPGDFFDQGFQIPQYRQKGTEKQEVSSGTGFIVSPDGLILTNKHVVSEEGAEFTVLMNNGDKYPAKVLAVDPVQDIAVLKIEKKNLAAVALGDSDSIQVGQTVIAIGNSLGEFRNPVSAGVVSGLRRTITAQGGGGGGILEDLIQTDAAIKPGNSGGPLINLKGEVIGINTAMTQGAQNIGFALPINKAKKDLDLVKKTGKISYPFLGVRYVLIDKDWKNKNILPVDYGARVVRGEAQTALAVTPGKVGLRFS